MAPSKSSSTKLKAPPKKRGRKPKGGKLISTVNVPVAVTVPEPNIVLHLKCRLDELDNNAFLHQSTHKKSSDVSSQNKNIISFQFENNKIGDLPYNIISNKKNTDEENNYKSNNLIANQSTNNTITNKLKTLALNLKTDTIPDNKSACFWCTCNFDNPPVYIPTSEFNGTYQCYGCFCSPECATAHLFKEPLDTATRFERYHLLNYLYCQIYNHKKNIKPAPDPRYTLDKYYGNLTIQEYRQLLENDRLLLVVNKPLTRILPELHEDNENFVLDTGAAVAGGHLKLRRKPKPTKAQILSNKFNMPQVNYAS